MLVNCLQGWLAGWCKEDPTLAILGRYIIHIPSASTVVLSQIRRLRADALTPMGGPQQLSPAPSRSRLLRAGQGVSEPGPPSQLLDRELLSGHPVRTGLFR